MRYIYFMKLYAITVINLQLKFRIWKYFPQIELHNYTTMKNIVEFHEFFYTSYVITVKELLHAKIRSSVNLI
jgi:hypothetical protein